MSSELDSLCTQAVEMLKDAFRAWRTPTVFVECGTGFEPERLFDGECQSLELNRLPGMPQQKTPDQEHPLLLYGEANGVPVLATKGHRHLYEGGGILPCILPLCTAHRLGVNTVILLDSGLSLQKEIKPGTWVLLTDFINYHHVSPLDGNHSMLENAFPDMTCALSQPLNSELMNALHFVGISPRLGVYLSRPGSQFCTVSEANAARSAGADIIGHDMVMEIIMGHALGCKVSAFALATVMAPDFYSQPLSRANVLDVCRFCSSDMMRGLRRGIREYADSILA